MSAKGTHGIAVGASVRVAVKPERVALIPGGTRPADDSDGLPAEIESVAYLGSFYSYIVAVGPQRIEARCGEPLLDSGRPAIAGAHVWLRFSPDAARLFA